MKVAIIYNKDLTGVINQFGLQNKERYNPKTVEKVAAALEQGGHNVEIIDGNMHVIEKLQEFMPNVIEGEKMGMVFNMAYGIQGESRYTHLPAMLEMLGIPYIGSGPTGHGLALDKVITKIILQREDINTPNFRVFSSSKEQMDNIQYPVIVKPKMEAVSYGIEVVDNEDDLRRAVQFVISEFQQQALVEQFIKGREFCVGLLGNGDPVAFPVLEIDLANDPCAIQTDFDKRKQPRAKTCPAEITKELSNKMIKLSKKAFRSLDLRDFGRVDIRMDKNNNIYVLEINSMASLGPTGSYVHAAKVAGFDYDRLINRILEVAAVRYFADKILIQEDGFQVKKKIPLTVRIRGYLRSKQGQLEKLLSKAVNINSYLRNVEGVNTLGGLVLKRLKNLGFDHNIYYKSAVGNIIFAHNSSDEEYDVLLLCHLDGSTPFTKHNHYHETEHKLYGTGIWKNKGGLVVMIAALRALRFVRLLPKIKIGVLLTTDDTLQGKISKDTIIDISQKAKTVLGLSGASPKSTMVTSRSGAAVYNLQMKLIKADSAQDVTHANTSFHHLLTTLTKLSRTADNLVVIPRNVNINSSIRNLYANGEASLSVRFHSTEQGEIVDEKIRKSVKRTRSKKCRFQISGSIRRPPMYRTKEIEDLYQLIRKIGYKLDIRTLEEHRLSSGDICFVDLDKPKIDGLGPVGDAPQNGKEYILRHSLLDRAVLLALTIYELRKR